MVDVSQFQAVFFEECHDLLAATEDHLSALKEEESCIDDIHAIFRAVHSIKGGAGSFNLDKLVSFAHVFETVLDELRNDQLKLTKDLQNILLRSNDVLADLVHSAESGDAETVPDHYEELKTILGEIVGAPKETTSKVIEVVEEKSEDSLFKYKVKFLPHENMMQFGNEPQLIIRELESLSNDDFSVTLLQDKLPSISDLEFDSLYLGWDLEFTSKENTDRIKEAFEFVESECSLDVDFEDLSPQPKENSSNEKSVKKGPSAKKTSKAHTEEVVKSIRVELDRIDMLVNTVGEMVIKQAMVIDQTNKLDGDQHNDLLKGIRELSQHTRDLQEGVMAIRAQPIKAVFSRMPRVVRELALALGKDIVVETIGEDTEIDKTVIERLGEPMTHMIRNSVDHGIEDKQERIDAGKPEQGVIQLTAAHKSGRIVIQIKDDGKGINRKAVLSRAIERELIPEDHQLSDEEIDNLIFMPGFSTAEKVTNISGRGVGMDVVKRSIQSLGGRVVVNSVQGKGSCVTLTLPLTLAVLDGMIVAVGGECFVIPILSIVETLRPQEAKIMKVVGGDHLLNLRETMIPLIPLYDKFNIDNAITDISKSIVVVAETEGGNKVGIVVDDLVGQQQVVIKSLEENYDPIPGVSAATILGNGRVALILDINVIKSLSNTGK